MLLEISAEGLAAFDCQVLSAALASSNRCVRRSRPRSQRPSASSQPDAGSSSRSRCASNARDYSFG